jgi:hypothetical protein
MGDLAEAADSSTEQGRGSRFAAHLAPLRRVNWVVYAKRPFGGPQAVLAYLSRYTHRVAIAKSRLIACDRNGVTFRWKDYRAEGHHRQKVMTLATGEFIRRFLIHVLPQGFHRIRHYGLLASGTRADNIARARRLLDASAAQPRPRIPASPRPTNPNRSRNRGSHLRVHGSTTGIPMNEVSIVTAPQRSAPPAPVVAGYANRNADISVLLKDGC